MPLDWPHSLRHDWCWDTGKGRCPAQQQFAVCPWVSMASDGTSWKELCVDCSGFMAVTSRTDQQFSVSIFLSKFSSRLHAIPERSRILEVRGDTVHSGNEGMVTGTGGCCSHSIHRQEAEWTGNGSRLQYLSRLPGDWWHTSYIGSPPPKGAASFQQRTIISWGPSKCSNTQISGGTHILSSVTTPGLLVMFFA